MQTGVGPYQKHPPQKEKHPQPKEKKNKKLRDANLFRW